MQPEGFPFPVFVYRTNQSWNHIGVPLDIYACCRRSSCTDIKAQSDLFYACNSNISLYLPTHINKSKLGYLNRFGWQLTFFFFQLDFWLTLCAGWNWLRQHATFRFEARRTHEVCHWRTIKGLAFSAKRWGQRRLFSLFDFCSDVVGLLFLFHSICLNSTNYL